MRRRRGAEGPQARLAARYGPRADDDLAHQVLQAATAPWLLPPATPTPTAGDVRDALVLVGDALARHADVAAALDAELRGPLDLDGLRDASAAMDVTLTTRVRLEAIQAGLIGAAATAGMSRAEVQAATELPGEVLARWYRSEPPPVTPAPG